MSGDRQGRSRAITVISEIKPFWAPINQLLFVITQALSSRSRLHKVPLLHFLRFCVVRKLPHNGPQPRERLRHPLLILEDHYAGLTDPYIETFVIVLRPLLRLVWHSSYGYAGVKSVSVFTRQLKRLAYPGAHYYSAYPDATVRMIRSALAVSREQSRLRSAADSPDAAEFAHAYRAFLIRRQEDL
jgi:hypothetical protein